MSFLLDTNIVSEWTKSRPSLGVTAWLAEADEQGRPMSAMDALLAATAEVHALTLVTRNNSDFAATVKSILNPWT